MQAVKSSESPYNANTNWDNEEKYLKGLSAGGNTWADDQLKTLYAEKAKYTQPSKPVAPSVNISTPVRDQSPLINDLYKAQQDAALAELKSAYDENVLTMDAAAKKIPGVYQQGRNRAAADADVSARNFNQYAAANGLNTGAAGQTQLAMRNQLQSGLSDISRQEADAMASLELERSRLQTQYQNAVAQAIATGDLEKAKALYSEAVRVDEMMISVAYQNAQLALQQAELERALFNDEYERQLLEAENKAKSSPVINYDPGKYYDAILTTASNMNTTTEAGVDYLTTYLAQQKARGNLTDYGVQAVLSKLGL